MITKWPVCRSLCPGKTRGGESRAECDGAAPQPHLQLNFHALDTKKLSLSFSLDPRIFHLPSSCHFSPTHGASSPPRHVALVEPETSKAGSFVQFRDLFLNSQHREETRGQDGRRQSPSPMRKIMNKIDGRDLQTTPPTFFRISAWPASLPRSPCHSVGTFGLVPFLAALPSSRPLFSPWLTPVVDTSGICAARPGHECGLQRARSLPLHVLSIWNKLQMHLDLRGNHNSRSRGFHQGHR